MLHQPSCGEHSFAAEPDRGVGGKLAYASPSLCVFGTVRDLTMGANGSGAESNNCRFEINNPNASCMV